MRGCGSSPRWCCRRIGGVGMWSVIVALPAVQAEFGVARADASLPYTMTMIGFGFGGILMGRLSDRFGIIVPVAGGASRSGSATPRPARPPSLWQFTLAQGLLVGVGQLRDVRAAARRHLALVHAPARHRRRRSLRAATISPARCGRRSSQHFIDSARLAPRPTSGIAVFCVATMLPLTLAAAAPAAADRGRLGGDARARVASPRPLGLSPRRAADAARHRRPSLLRRDVDAAGPHRRLLRRSRLRRRARRADAVADARLRHREPARVGLDLRSHRRPAHAAARLEPAGRWRCLLFLPFDGLASLYVISALFGLFQGGIVPAYAIIVREYFPPRRGRRARRHGADGHAFGMALGGWMSGVIFDLTGSYRAAFINGIAVEPAERRDRRVACCADR